MPVNTQRTKSGHQTLDEKPHGTWRKLNKNSIKNERAFDGKEDLRLGAYKLERPSSSPQTLAGQ